MCLRLEMTLTRAEKRVVFAADSSSRLSWAAWRVDPCDAASGCWGQRSTGGKCNNLGPARLRPHTCDRGELSFIGVVRGECGLVGVVRGAGLWVRCRRREGQGWHGRRCGGAGVRTACWPPTSCCLVHVGCDLWCCRHGPEQNRRPQHFAGCVLFFGTLAGTPFTACRQSDFKAHLLFPMTPIHVASGGGGTP